MADTNEFADVEIVDDDSPTDAAPPEQGESAPKPTSSPQRQVQLSPQARHAVAISAGVLGLSGFASVCVVGLAVGLPGSQILLRAVGALFICWFVGLLLAEAFLVLIREHLQRHQQEHPRPEQPKELDTPAVRSRQAA